MATSTDARGKVTSYSYHAQGVPMAVTSPADAAGVQPVTTYGYTAYTAAGFSPFYLQTLVSQKTSASNTVLSTTSYNAANKYVPQTVVADAGTGKLNITSTLSFDAVGNPTLADGPRMDVSDTVATVYDAERRPTQVTNALGKLTRMAYDADGRLVRSAAQIGTRGRRRVCTAWHTRNARNAAPPARWLLLQMSARSRCTCSRCQPISMVSKAAPAWSSRARARPLSPLAAANSASANCVTARSCAEPRACATR